MLRLAMTKLIDVVLAFVLLYGAREIIRDMVLLIDPDWSHFLESPYGWVTLLLLSVLCVATGLLSLSAGIKPSQQASKTNGDSDNRD